LKWPVGKPLSLPAEVEEPEEAVVVVLVVDGIVFVLVTVLVLVLVVRDEPPVVVVESDPVLEVPETREPAEWPFPVTPLEGTATGGIGELWP
jgi:hypothetical protein